jgi:hypothetical protein
MRLVGADLYPALRLKEPDRRLCAIENAHRPHIAGGWRRQFPIGQVVEPKVDVVRAHQHLPSQGMSLYHICQNRRQGHYRARTATKLIPARVCRHTKTEAQAATGRGRIHAATARRSDRSPYVVEYDRERDQSGR